MLMPRSSARGGGAALLLHEPRDGIDGAEVIELEIFILDGDAELMLHEGDELHREHRVDEAEAEDVLVLQEVMTGEEARKVMRDLRLGFLRAHVPPRAACPAFMCTCRSRGRSSCRGGWRPPSASAADRG